MGKIILKGMKFRVNIGTTDNERAAGSDVTINLTYNCNTLRAGMSDNLADAVDYSRVFSSIKDETRMPCNLIENLAHRIMGRLKVDFPEISDLKLTLFKSYPAVEGELEMSGIELES